MRNIAYQPCVTTRIDSREGHAAVHHLQTGLELEVQLADVVVRDRLREAHDLVVRDDRATLDRRTGDIPHKGEEGEAFGKERHGT